MQERLSHLVINTQLLQEQIQLFIHIGHIQAQPPQQLPLNREGLLQAPRTLSDPQHELVLDQLIVRHRPTSDVLASKVQAEAQVQ